MEAPAIHGDRIIPGNGERGKAENAARIACVSAGPAPGGSKGPLTEELPAGGAEVGRQDGARAAVDPGGAGKALGRIRAADGVLQFIVRAKVQFVRPTHVLR
jgi:hypothetical protein